MHKSPDRYPYTSGYAEPQDGGSRTPFDSRAGSPVAAGPMGYDSTLPSAGLEALSAVAAQGRRGKEPEQTLDLAVRMDSLAPRKAGMGGSLSSLMNAYDQGVGATRERKNPQTESE